MSVSSPISPIYLLYSYVKFLCDKQETSYTTDNTGNVGRSMIPLGSRA